MNSLTYESTLSYLSYQIRLTFKLDTALKEEVITVEANVRGIDESFAGSLSYGKKTAVVFGKIQNGLVTIQNFDTYRGLILIEIDGFHEVSLSKICRVTSTLPDSKPILLFEHDGEGFTKSGDKNLLLTALRECRSIRVKLVFKRGMGLFSFDSKLPEVSSSGEEEINTMIFKPHLITCQGDTLRAETNQFCVFHPNFRTGTSSLAVFTTGNATVMGWANTTDTNGYFAVQCHYDLTV
jgi:hypothetical protein